MKKFNEVFKNDEDITVSGDMQFFIDLVKDRDDLVASWLRKETKINKLALVVKIGGTEENPIYGFIIYFDENGKYDSGGILVNDAPTSGLRDESFFTMLEMIESNLRLVDMISGDIIVRRVTTEYEDLFNHMVDKLRENEAKKDELSHEYYKGYSDCLNHFFDFKKN